MLAVEPTCCAGSDPKLGTMGAVAGTGRGKPVTDDAIDDCGGFGTAYVENTAGPAAEPWLPWHPHPPPDAITT